MVSEIEAIIAAIIPILTAAGFLKKGQDTNSHGDAFLSMLKDSCDSLEQVAKVLPKVAPYVEQYRKLIEEGEEVWNSRGFTAQDIALIQTRAAMLQTLITDAVSKYKLAEKGS